VSGFTALTTLELRCCHVTDEVLRAVSSLPSLTLLDLTGCDKVTAAGVQAPRNTTTTPYLRIDWYPPPEVEEYEEDQEDQEDGGGLGEPTAGINLDELISLRW
jgi:hypothetical protein